MEQSGHMKVGVMAIHQEMDVSISAGLVSGVIVSVLFGRGVLSANLN